MGRGLRFEVTPNPAAASVRRADVALFVGFGVVRPGPALDAARRAARSNGWEQAESVGERLPLLVESGETLQAVLERFELGDAGLAWEVPLAGAVLDFFRHGGQRAWLVVLPASPRPTEPTAVPAWRAAAIDSLIPGFALDPGAPTTHGWVDPRSRDTWRGLALLAGLAEVSFALVPDLPHLLRDDAPTEDPTELLPTLAPQFDECSDELSSPPLGRLVRRPTAPTVGDTALSTWCAATRTARENLQRLGREDVQLVLALPLGEEGSLLAADPVFALEKAEAWRDWRDGGIASACVQVATPWLEGRPERPGGLASPDAALAGILAANALSRGTFRTVVRLPTPAVPGVFPRLRPRAYATTAPAFPGASTRLGLTDRICVFAQETDGITLLSDVTTSSDGLWRTGGPSRLAGVLRRLLREAGEEVVFESNHPDTRRLLVRQLVSALEDVEQAGGIAAGPDGTPAFRVRCDDSTHTSSDLDGGRMVAEIEVRPVPALELIRVALTLRDGQLAFSEAS